MIAAVVVVHSHSALVEFPFFLSRSRQSRLGKPIFSLKGIKFLKNPHPIFVKFFFLLFIFYGMDIVVLVLYCG